MKKFNRDILLSAVKDAFFSEDYGDYSIGSGFMVCRNDDVESWEDEGITIFDNNGDVICSYCVELFCEDEEEWFFEKGKVLEKLVDYTYEEQLSFIKEYKHIAQYYYADDLRSALEDGDMTKDEVLEESLDEISYILGEWIDNDDEEAEEVYLEEDWWDEAVPALKEYFDIVNNDCETPLPDWIKTDIERIQQFFDEDRVEEVYNS